MALKDIAILEPLVPNEDGTGNEVLLASLPYYDSEGTKAKIVFTFIDPEDDEIGFRHNQFEPFDNSNTKARDIGLNRLMSIYGALMPKESYEKIKSYDYSNDEDCKKLVAFANKLVDKDVIGKEKLTVLVGYNERDQRYLALAGGLGAVISSKFKPKKLKVNPEMGILLVQKDKSANVPDKEASGNNDDAPVM